MKTLTLEEAKNLKHGQVLYHTINRATDGTAQKWRVNGKVQTWKRDSKLIKVPIKNGLRNCDYLTQDDLGLVSLWNSKRFSLLSDAKKFQKEMRDAGYKTALKHHLGIPFPFRVVEFIYKSNK
jgi:hypothetical protein